MNKSKYFIDPFSRDFLIAPGSGSIGKHTKAIRLSLLFGLLTSVFATTAQADVGNVHAFFPATLEGSPPINHVEVRSDGSNYTKTDSPLVEIVAQIHVEIDAEISGRVKSWEAWPRTIANLLNEKPIIPQDPLFSPQITVQQDHYSSGQSASYPLGYRPKQVVDTFPVSIDFKNTAVTYCNLMADELRQQGFTNSMIFDEDRTVEVAVSAGLEYETSGVSGNPLGSEVVAWSNLPTFDLVCLADPMVDDFEIERIARLTSVTLDMFHETEPTECPAEVTAYATFVADMAGDFSFRYRSVFGQVSQPIELEMGPENLQGDLYIKTYQLAFLVGVPEIPVDPGSGGRPGIGVGGFSPINGDEPPFVEPDPTHPGAGIDDFAVGESKPNVHQDSIWIEVVSAGAGSVNKSDYADYKITCELLSDPDTGGPGEWAPGAKNSINDPTRNPGVLARP